jgi:hypothetical protein
MLLSAEIYVRVVCCYELPINEIYKTMSMLQPINSNHS